MVRFETMWPSRRFRGMAGYMFAASRDVKVFARPVYDFHVLDHVEFQLLVGPGQRIEESVTILTRDGRSERTKLQTAAREALEQFGTHLDDVAATWTSRAKALSIAERAYDEYPNCNGG